MRFNSSIISKQPFEVIHLKDKQTGTAVEIYAMGALLNSFKVPVKDGYQNVIDGFDNA
jgi:aldose 1-epimerase